MLQVIVTPIRPSPGSARVFFARGFHGARRPRLPATGLRDAARGNGVPVFGIGDTHFWLRMMRCSEA